MRFGNGGENLEGMKTAMSLLTEPNRSISKSDTKCCTSDRNEKTEPQMYWKLGRKWSSPGLKHRIDSVKTLEL